MKTLLTSLTLTLLLTACSSHPADATQSEINMAEMMGITVQELRNQTPEEHMRMMMEMHTKKESKETMEEKEAREAKPSAVLEVGDGDTIELNPMIVSKEINGKTFRMYGYNGQLPGPTIRTTQGSSITVTVRNMLDTETTVHWHGLRHDNKDDGVPDVTQKPIQPNGIHTYTLRFPDDGIYWYHPHVREDVQQDMGLYGVIDVRPQSEESDPPLIDAEEILVLDDMLLGPDGNTIAYGKDDPNFALMGRFGNLPLLNMQPAGEYEISANKGDIVRFHFINTANTRTFRVRIDGARMKKVLGDMGYYEQEEFVDAITIAPAERYSVDVLFENEGTYTLLHESPLTTFALADITVQDRETANPNKSEIYDYEHDIVGTQEDIDAYRPYFDIPVDKTLVLDIELNGHMMQMHQGMNMMHHDETGIEWEDTMPMMNQMMASEDFQWKLIDKDTGEQNMDFLWEFEQGDIVKIRIENKEDSAHPMHHPMHFHGQRFLVLNENGVPNQNLVWKDTVLVPIGHTVDLLFDMSNPGDWMMHCHIAEHLSNGMMGMFRVTE